MSCLLLKNCAFTIMHTQTPFDPFSRLLFQTRDYADVQACYYDINDLN